MNMISWDFWLIPLAGIVSLLCALYFYVKMIKLSEGTQLMVHFASQVRRGAKLYLKQQYKVVIIVFILLAISLAVLYYVFGLVNGWVWFAFLTSGSCSAIAGYIGMKSATEAAVRVANTARLNLKSSLKLSFRSGAIMGLVVVGFALLDLSFWMFVLYNFTSSELESVRLIITTMTMLTFAIGASTQALFARVGGGIFTKAADMGADLVGKMEYGLKEDDSNNPAVIADNVGDNVGDIAGMGADLYESYIGALMSAATLGAIAYMSQSDLQISAVKAPYLVATVGAFISILIVFCVRIRENTNQGGLLRMFNLTIGITSVLIAVISYFLITSLKLPVGIWGAIVTGLFIGITLGHSTEYFTSSHYNPTRTLLKSAETGSAPLIIKGISMGMISTWIPICIVAVGVIICYLLGTDFNYHEFDKGVYGVSLGAVGMLSTLIITLSIDAMGPIVDNAGGNAQMSQLGDDVRARTDLLDSIGNTTAAIGKGFAIGSTALTALALISSYLQELRLNMVRMVVDVNNTSGVLSNINNISFNEVLTYYNISILNPTFIVGLLLGGMLSFLFCGFTMNGVGNAASSMIREVRRIFQDSDSENRSGYERCIFVATKAAQREMIIPAMIALISPLVVGIIFGVAAVVALLLGTLSTGFVLAIFMSNAGGMWDNAKKMVEEGVYGGIGSDVHKVTIVGDTVGDPFKDSAGPSINILIKLMSIVAIISVGIIVSI